MNQQLEEILRAIPKFQDADFEKIYNGTFNEVCQVRNKNINYIAKMALKDLKSDRFQGIEIDPFARINIEFCVARLYADILCGHHIPNIRYYYPDKCIIVMDEINGILWRKQLIEGNFDPSVLIRLGSVIGRLHAGTYRKYSEDIKLANPDAWEAELKYHFYDLLPKVDDKSAKIIEQRAINHRKDRSVLLHGDLVTRNIIIDDQGEFFLIDFELSRLGNPSYDLGHLFGDFFLFIGYCPKYKYEVLSALKQFLDNYLNEFPYIKREIFEEEVFKDTGISVLSRLSGAALQSDFLKSEKVAEKMKTVGYKLLNETIDFQNIGQLY